MRLPSTTTALAGYVFATTATARSIPDNVKAFYSSVVSSGDCTGTDLLKGGFYDTDGGQPQYGYCRKNFPGGLYLKGPGSKLVNMDIDCDGSQSGLDSRCEASTDTQAQTAFQDQVAKYGIPDLKADVHPYVVLGNQGDYSPTFDPQSVGIRPLSVVAVVCGEQLIYGVWGDTNGDDGPPLVGEASLAVGTACFGRENIGGNNGHDQEDVLYIAFAGEEAVPGDKADWKAASYEEFEKSIVEIGDRLVASL